MVYLLFVFLPVLVALYTYLVGGRYRQLTWWAALLALGLEGYLCAFLPLQQPVRLMGATFSLTAEGRLFIYAFLLMAGAVMATAYALRQGDLPIPIALFVLGVACATVLLDDLFVIALLLEIIGLAVVLGTVDRPQEPLGLLPVPALMAGLKYLTMMVLSGIALVMGFLMVGRFLEVPQQVAYAKMALGLLVVGFGLGTAIVPFHLWFPDLAGHTSTAVSGLLVSLVQGAALLLLGQFFMRFPELLQSSEWAMLGLTVGAVAAGLVAALLAIGQDRLKRLAAYAASYNIAAILCAFSLADAPGFEAGFLLTMHHGLALVLLLVCIGVLEWSTGRDDVAGLVGVGRRMPVVALGLVVSTLSLAGIPPLGGFVSRWLLYVQAFSRGWWYLAGLLLAAALFLLAVVRALWPCFLPTEQTVAFRKPPWPALLVILLLVLALLSLGLYPHPVMAVLREAAMRSGTA